MRPPEADDFGFEEPDDGARRAQRIARLRLLWERRRTVLRVTGYGLLAATLVAFLIPKRYESTARLMPPDSQSASGVALLAALSARTGGLGGFAGDLLGLKSSGALFVGVLRSRTVEDRLVQQFDLKSLYGVTRSEDARLQLERNTRIAEDRKSGIITLVVTDRHPQRAQLLAQAYVDELDRVIARVGTSAARRERVFLEQRLVAVKQELDQAAQEFSQFASKNTAIDIKEQGRAMVEAAAALQGQLIAARTELESLRQIYTDNNVRVRALRARVAELQHQLEKLGGKDVSPSNPAPSGSDTLYPSIRKLPLLGVQYADLYRRTKIAEVVYELLTQQYELARVQEAREIPTVRVLDAPVLPEKKSFPPRLILILAGTLLTLVATMGLVLANARWAEFDPQDSGKVLASEVYATIRSRAVELAGNGAGPRGWVRRIWDRPDKGAGMPKDEEQSSQTGRATDN